MNRRQLRKLSFSFFALAALELACSDDEGQSTQDAAGGDFGSLQQIDSAHRDAVGMRDLRSKDASSDLVIDTQRSDGARGRSDSISCPPCVPPPHPGCTGSGPCGCGPYRCPIGVVCSGASDCVSGVCWDFAQRDSLCSGKVCSSSCSGDEQCRGLAASAGAAEASRATCDSQDECDFVGTGLGRFLCQ